MEFQLHKEQIPAVMQWLLKKHFVHVDDIFATSDRFYMIYQSLSSILHTGGIDRFPDREDRILECNCFFDDWFLFAVPFMDDYVYGLLKMREQEFDQENGMIADGDTPGVTVSFIAFDIKVLQSCLEDPSASNRKRLGIEINRVVAYPKQKHNAVLKQYFVRPEAEAPYLIAEMYTKHIASFSEEHILPVPIAYLDILQKRQKNKKYTRIPDFLDQNNRDAGMIICDHQNIYIKDVSCLSPYEKRAILAAYTGNVSVHSFAAEVRYHAFFLVDLAKIRLPIVGSPYASAVRADMSIGDKEFQGPTPYYNLAGKMVKTQMDCHGELKNHL